MSVTDFLLTLEHVVCDVEGCGIVFGLTPQLHGAMKREGRKVYCPNGHHISYTETELDRMRRRLAQETHRAEQAAADADFWRGQSRRRERVLRAVKGHSTRLRKRLAAGVCPCCHRTFQALARHMKARHPGFGGKERA